MLLPHDYVNFWLTGRLCMEVCGGWLGWAGVARTAGAHTSRVACLSLSFAAQLSLSPCRGPRCRPPVAHPCPPASLSRLEQASDASGTGLFDMAGRSWDAGDGRLVGHVSRLSVGRLVEGLHCSADVWCGGGGYHDAGLLLSLYCGMHAVLTTSTSSCPAERIRQLDQRLASCLPPLIGPSEVSALGQVLARKLRAAVHLEAAELCIGGLEQLLPALPPMLHSLHVDR